MATNTDLGNPANFQLLGSKDWFKWISIIEKFAVNENIWAYINPSVQDRPTLQQPVEPTASTIKPHASSILDLDDSDFTRLQYMTNIYRTALQDYKDKKKALVNIQRWIIATIGNYYDTISQENDVAAQLYLLKQRLQPTTWDHEKDVRQRYTAVLRSPNRTKISSWITSYKKVLAEAININLPDTQGLRPTQDFIDAVESITPAFSNYWKNRIKEKQRNNKEGWEKKIPDGHYISDLFEQEFASQQQRAQGAFASFQDMDTNKNQQKTTDITKPKQPCICGLLHR
ncbi:hypothetical protein UVI_02064380 [Ustilaginoidea virens]|uniref:Gag protein n=1 Tax=Ustilaginoidea virens TaxID=1159556 RepID=A0A1B5V8R5_USTVR|nr:hypothetical protein UVI_02064380 [Ustilaginoidea virens]